MAGPLEPTPSRDYDAITFAAAAVAAAASPPGGDAPDLRAICRLHGRYSMYTRNSNGYYATYSPPCNGCSVGAREALENAAADHVRDLHAQLNTIWATEYGRHTTERAESFATALRTAITALNATSRVITTPQQYAARMLAGHAAAAELDRLLVEAILRGPTAARRRQITVAMDCLRRSNCVNPTIWPIWIAATEMLASLEDHVADDSY